MTLSTSSRRAVRRDVRTRCQAVGLSRFRLLGEQVLDLSPRGMLVACDTGVELGEDVLVSFRAPGQDRLWMDAEAQIARVVNGYRPGDRGYCIGLDFTYLERVDRNELLTRLVGVPPPVPQRRLRGARDRRRGPGSVRIDAIVSIGAIARARAMIPRGVFMS